jgi:hypothetical protein
VKQLHDKLPENHYTGPVLEPGGTIPLETITQREIVAYIAAQWKLNLERAQVDAKRAQLAVKWLRGARSEQGAFAVNVNFAGELVITEPDGGAR